ncbi:MAG: DUF2090 domain-containing protein [Protaetiibacter sp.]
MTANPLEPLYMLAFDHRASLVKMFGPNGGTQNGRVVDFAELKGIIFDALFASLAELGLDPSDVGILVDEEFGAAIAARAKEAGIILAMPAEKSLEPIFQLEYGDDFAAHIERFDPDQVKVLLIHNSGYAPEDDALQLSRLRALSDWLKPRRQRFMIELLVHPSEEELASVGGDRARFMSELMPGLMLGAIRRCQDAGIDADVWKVEGLETTAQYAAVAELARSGGRDHVECIILGAGAPDAVVAEWLRAAAPVRAFTGFAIGRSTWQDALAGYMDGSLTREAAVAAIAEQFGRWVRLYEDARAAA